MSFKCTRRIKKAKMNENVSDHQTHQEQHCTEIVKKMLGHLLQ